MTATRESPEVVPAEKQVTASGRARGVKRTVPRWAWVLVALALPTLIIVVWVFLTTTGIVPPWKLPTISSIFVAAVDLWQRGELGLYILISLQRVLLGFAIGGTLGLVLGALVGLSRFWDTFFSGTLGALRAVPSLAWAPLLLLWFLYGEDSKVILIAIGAFFPVYTTVSQALRHVDRNLVEAARAFGLTGIPLFTTVQLPAVLPSVVSGLRLALAQSWLFLVAAELLGASMGLGFLLTQSQAYSRTDWLFLAIILLAVMGKATDSLIGLFERWAKRRWT